MSTTVHVKNIAPQTSEKEVRDFFSFCGKIASLSVTPTADAPESPKSATVTFEKETAAKTALLLDHTVLGASQVSVSSAANLDDIAPGKTSSGEESKDDDDVEQEDKPRSRIVAEYLAHGYALSDQAIQHAIELDNKHGISARFTSALTNFDSKYHATDKVKGLDSSYGLTNKANAGWRGLNSYFEKALGTPTGQRVREFYTQSDKQVRDIHAEARRLADLKSGKRSDVEHVPGTDDKTTCKCGSSTEKCACAPGTCACANCAKSSPSSSTAAEPHKAPGNPEKSVCSCGGDNKECPCAEGKCACAGCAKSG